jgi:hypothetical protein
MAPPATQNSKNWTPFAELAATIGGSRNIPIPTTIPTTTAAALNIEKIGMGRPVAGVSVFINSRCCHQFQSIEI